MRSNRKRSTQWTSTVNLLVVLVAPAIVPHIAGAFQLWPNKLTKALGNNRQDSTHRLTNIQHRLAAATTTTTTTTSTTTQMPPIELHFEINPDDLEQHQQGHQEPDELGELVGQSANGTLILEDLVSQFERNFNLKRVLKANTKDEPRESSFYRTNSTLLLGSQEFNRSSAQKISSGSPANRSAQYTMSEPPGHAGASQVSMELFDGRAAHQEEKEPTTRSSQIVNDSLVDTPYPPDLDPDRHIQYDTPVEEHEHNKPAEKQTGDQRMDHLLDWSGAASLGRLNATTEMPAGTEQTPLQNFTLALKSLTSGNHQQSPSSLLIVSAAKNVSVAAGTTSSKSLPTILKSDSSTTPERDNSLASPPPHAMLRSAGSSQAQARSISGISSRLPQHSKAPYASYNMFNHRSDPNNKPPTSTVPPSPSNGVKFSPPGANQEISNSGSSSQNVHLTPPPPAANQSSEAEASSTPSGAELVNSINKISSHLVSDEARGEASGSTRSSLTTSNTTSTTTTTITTTTTTPKPTTLVDQLQSYLNSTANQNFNGRQEKRDELERMVSKLAPPNELIELDPLPSDSQGVIQAAFNGRQYSNSHQESPAHSARQGSQNRYSTPTELELNSMGVGQLSSLGIYQANSDEHTNQHQLPVRSNPERAHDLRAVVSSLTGDASLHDGNADDNDDSSPPILHRKTIETLSSQIKQSDNNILSASSNTLAVHQHKERSPPQQQVMMAPLNRDVGGPGGTFAASLTNVTAPMVLPLSASEAMEESMASLNKHHGHQLGPTTNTSLRPSLSHHHQHFSPHRSSHYVIPPPPVVPHDSIYSRPVNQFRPTTHSPHNSTDREISGGGSMLSAAERERMRIGNGHYGSSSSSSSSSTLSASQLASGFRSPINQYPTAAQTTMMGTGWPSFDGSGHTTSLPTPASYLTGLESATASSSSLAPLSSSPPSPSSTSANTSKFASSIATTPIGGTNRDNNNGRPQTNNGKQQLNATMGTAQPPVTTNGFIIGSVVNTTLQPSQIEPIGAATTSNGAGDTSPPGNQGGISSQVVASGQQQGAVTASNRVFNLTRVEHISAECSNDLIRTIIIFNGTFKGIIYSSGYVRDPNCLYINGTGKTRYDFSIRLNQCGTLGRQELHSPSGPDEVRRRDQVMWNSLSIQYNPIIEQEWDEHFRVSCEYGSDFWKTVSFSPFNVETNTGSPVVFTVDPPQCQMEILKGHGMVGPRQEAISGPVTVGDPLTLLIHMKSEKAGYDILVKNCIAHNGGQQKMQLIDSNGCVVNERFISPFRGTYNDNDLKHVTLYSYLKAFRFTGSPVLYLECEVHMCQSACPPQMCYWRRLSKRSVRHSLNGTTRLLHGHTYNATPDDEEDGYESFGVLEAVESLPATTTTETTTTATRRVRRTSKKLQSAEDPQASAWSPPPPPPENLSDKISLFQALEVRQERFTDPTTAASLAPYRSGHNDRMSDLYEAGGGVSGVNQLMCYQRVEIFAFLFTVASILLAAISVTIGCYCRTYSLKRQSMKMMSHGHESGATRIRHSTQKYPRARPLANSLSSINSANLCYSPMLSSSSSASSPLSSPSSSCGLGGGSSKNFARLPPYSNLAATILSDAGQQVYGHLSPALGATNNKGDNLARPTHTWVEPQNQNQTAVLSKSKQQLAKNCADNTNNERLLARRS